MKEYQGKKRFRIILLAGLLIVSALGTSILVTANNMKPVDEKTGSKNKQLLSIDNNFESASDIQKQELEKVLSLNEEKFPEFTVGDWVRDTLIIMEKLPKDTPRITLEEVKNIIKEKPFEELEENFNKICGSADFVGGSGIGRSIYFLNDEKTEYVMLMLNEVFYSSPTSNGEDPVPLIKDIETYKNDEKCTSQP